MNQGVGDITDLTYVGKVVHHLLGRGLDFDGEVPTDATV